MHAHFEFDNSEINPLTTRHTNEREVSNVMESWYEGVKREEAALMHIGWDLGEGTTNT